MDNLHLRRLTVFVDEPDPGDYYWVLIESTGDAAIWIDIDSSQAPVSSWEDAFDKGVVELKKRVPNKVLGPLIGGEDENGSPVGIAISS